MHVKGLFFCVFFICIMTAVPSYATDVESVSEQNVIPEQEQEQVKSSSQDDVSQQDPAMQDGSDSGQQDIAVPDQGETLSENELNEPDLQSELVGPVQETSARRGLKESFGNALKRSDADSEETILGYIEQMNQLNLNMTDIKDESDINQYLDQEDQVLYDLLSLLKITDLEKLPPVANSKELSFLISRMAINEEHGNDIAVERDKAKLAYYKTEQAIRDYIVYLINASRDYQGIDKIVSYTLELQSALRDKENRIAEPAEGLSGNVAEAYYANYTQFIFAEDTFQDLLYYVINNPEKIANSHWFQKFTLLSAISFVNSFDVAKSVNHWLAPLRVDVGGILVSLAIFLLVILSYPFVFKFNSWVCEKYILNKDSETDEIIYHELRRPIRFLMVFFGLDLARYALLYKAKYQLENPVFLIYTFVFVWFLFKVLDSIVISQYDKFSKFNKELRKDLVKLAMQLVKGVIFIIALAVVLNHFGVNITALMSTLGIGGVAFAFAAKDSISNLFGGVTILIDNVFKMGDWVKIEDVEGTVVEIGLRSTTIRTFDNSLVTVPNSIISVSSVKNWNRRAIGRRIKMYIGVTYESNMDEIKQALVDIREMLIAHPDVANPKQKVDRRVRKFRFSSHEDTQGIKSTQLVFLDRYNEYSIDILIYCFSRTVNWAEWLAVKEDVLFKIADILKKNNLEFAYPTQVNHMHFNQTESTQRIPPDSYDD